MTKTYYNQIMKKLFKTLFIFGLFVSAAFFNSPALVNASDECVLNDGDVIFSSSNGSIAGAEVKLKIATKNNCEGVELTVVIYEYDAGACLPSNCDEVIDMSNRKDKIVLKSKKESNVQIHYLSEEDDCEINDYPNCLLYVVITDKGNKEIYNSRAKMVNLAREMSEITAVEVPKLLRGKNTAGLLLKNCNVVFALDTLNEFLDLGLTGSCSVGNNNWTFQKITGGVEIGEDGEIIENDEGRPEPVYAEQDVDLDSPCITTTGKYDENCYEFLAPLPGFESFIGDPKDGISNIEDNNSEGRVAIKNLAEFELGDFVNSIFQIALGMLMVLAVIMIVIAGVEYMTVESIYGKSEAKTKITGAVTGLILALGIFLILGTIDKRLLEVNFGSRISVAEIGVQTSLSNESYQAITGKRKPLKGAILKQAIAAAKAEGVDYCAVEAILSKETRDFDAGAIGHDENVSGTKSNKALVKSNITYKGKTVSKGNDVPKEKIDWRFSAGIGLMQVTIFPSAYSTEKYLTNPPAWETRDTPRKHAESGYTWEELLEPEKNIRAGIKILKSKKSNNPKTAFTAYNGSGPRARNYGNDVAARYNQCCSENKKAEDPDKQCDNFLE